MGSYAQSRSLDSRRADQAVGGYLRSPLRRLTSASARGLRLLVGWRSELGLCDSGFSFGMARDWSRRQSRDILDIQVGLGLAGGLGLGCVFLLVAG